MLISTTGHQPQSDLRLADFFRSSFSLVMHRISASRADGSPRSNGNRLLSCACVAALAFACLDLRPVVGALLATAAYFVFRWRRELAFMSELFLQRVASRRVSRF